MYLSFNFEVHQPHRLNKFINNDMDLWGRYMDINLNKELFKTVSKKSYYPASYLLLDLIDEYDIKVSFSITGTFIEQALEYDNYLLDIFKDLVDTKNVELMTETYYHSLSCFISEEEFTDEVKKHQYMTKDLFKYEPKVFRNTELIYNNRVAKIIENMGFDGIFTEGVDRVLEYGSPNYLYKTLSGLKVLLRNYSLSDDIGFRFSSQDWSEYPLTAEKYANWINGCNGDCINLYMDYETIGEHHTKESGIFEFLTALPEQLAMLEDIEYATPSDLIKNCNPRGIINVFEHNTISWADMERDASAWLGNKMQDLAFQNLESLKNYINFFEYSKESQEYLLYKNLQTSDNFYYMCNKSSSDKDVHNYFSHFQSPYDAYGIYLNTIHDFKNYIILKSTNNEIIDDIWIKN
ncbi:glycoside hydrolase family 57 protein [Methanococcus voltae]|uniref:Alpha-amylase n=1 Tax=Methanococcus voltae (strain ATCC BAA-1334 / A3) TaxID=456320 RepID=D7DRF3_METV3|nr:glycoside hydrolase family 57 protein [Methanococcus voltae]MCS3901090.1 alpha-amylase [Methanococcus voltae]